VARGLRKLRDEQSQNLYSSLNIDRVIRTMRMSRME